MTTNSTRRDFLIRIEDHLGNVSYLVRKGKHVSYQSGGQTPFSLSNLVQSEATLLMWNLESTQDGSSALREVNKVLTEMWRNNPGSQPKTRCLDSRKPL